MHSRWLALGISIAASSGCVVFDEKLYKDLAAGGSPVKDSGMGGGGKDAGPMGEPDTGTPDTGMLFVDSGVDAGPVELHLVDHCDDPEIFVANESIAGMGVDVSSVELNDDVSSTACMANTAGSEGWLAVDMQVGERWHFHVRPLNEAKVDAGNGQNPVLYMRSDCEEDRQCIAGQFLNSCGDRQEEHFTFEATSTTRWFFALDDANAAKGKYKLTVSRPICGNAKIEHNEACEDGNLDPGDGCSQDCRKELPANQNAEEEINDDWTTANVLKVLDSAGMQSVTGRIGEECGVDMFSFQVPANGDVSVTVAPNSTTTCKALADTNVTPVTLRLHSGDGRKVIATGTAPVDGPGCPSLMQTDLSEGLYYVSLEGQEAPKDAMNYKLTVTVTP